MRHVYRISVEPGFDAGHNDVARLTRLTLDERMRSHSRQTMSFSKRNQKRPAEGLTVINGKPEHAQKPEHA